MTLSTADLRNKFIDYFKSHGHQAVASSSLVPADDPTLLFTNAGMNQFKDCFLGAEKRSYTRAVSSQRCVRAGGKHNDLETLVVFFSFCLSLCKVAKVSTTFMCTKKNVQTLAIQNSNPMSD